MLAKDKNNNADNLENEALSNNDRDGLLLSNISKENHFSAPNNYFKSLPEVINNKILDNKSLTFNIDRLSWRLLMPFTAIIIIFIAITNLNSTTENNTLTPDQLSEYIITENDFEFEDEMVYEAYAEVLNQESERSEDSAFDAEKEEYINYLIENDIDINSIIEEL